MNLKAFGLNMYCINPFKNMLNWGGDFIIYQFIQIKLLKVVVQDNIFSHLN